MTDLYEDLGVPRDASQEEIATAGKAAQKKYHPDMPGGDPEKFDRATKALTILRDPNKRAQYDKTGEAEAVSEEMRRFSSAMTLITTKLAPVLEPSQGFDIARRDVIAEVRAAIQMDIGQAKAKRGEFERGAEKVKEAKKRLKVGKGVKAKGSIMETILRSIAYSIQQNRLESQVDEAIACGELALELLADYDWTRDASSDPNEMARQAYRRVGLPSFFQDGF